MTTPDFGRLIRSRPIPIDLCEADENRFRLYVDRLNHGLFADDPLDPDDDEDMAVAIMGLATYALHLDETEHGLAGTAFGDVIPKEQADERVRRLMADLDGALNRSKEAVERLRRLREEGEK